ncbi:MAG: hypothetical protein QMD06_00290 [Candidatus Altarchaeum sp.]|nr:hypothetical protein [Candidatus Altarchaeum sp.]
MRIYSILSGFINNYEYAHRLHDCISTLRTIDPQIKEGFADYVSTVTCDNHPTRNLESFKHNPDVSLLEYAQ